MFTLLPLRNRQRDLFHDAQYGLTADVLEREINDVRVRIDGDGVSRGRKKTLRQAANGVIVNEYGDHAAFGGNVEPMRGSIQRKDIGVVTDAPGFYDAHRFQV